MAKKSSNKWPIWFVNPDTGNTLEFDLRTAIFLPRS
jgi:hypothetical protein